MTSFLSSAQSFLDLFSEFDVLLKDMYKNDRNGFEPLKVLKLSYPMDIFLEKNGTLNIQFSIPGLKKENIDVSVQGDNLRVTHKKDKEEVAEDVSYICKQISKKSFDLTWKLPKFDLSLIEVISDRGLLSIKVPPREFKIPDESKRIEIKEVLV